MLLRTATGAPTVPDKPLTIVKVVPGVKIPVTVGITVMPLASIFEEPDGRILP